MNCYTDTQEPIASIIMPIYNEQKSLKRAIKSVLKQTACIELICIDDGSDDDSLKILYKFSKKYSCIHVIKQNHKGAGTARNSGISKARGKYIAFLDADDIYPNKKSIEKLAEYAERYNLDVCGGLRIIDIDGHKNYSETNRKELKNYPDGRIINYSDTQIDYDYSNFIFRKDMILNNGLEFPNYSRYQDVPFFVKAMHTAKTYGIIPVVCYKYYIRSDNTVNYDESNTEGLLKSILDVLIFAQNNGYENLINRTINRWKNEYNPQINPQIISKYRQIVESIEFFENRIDCIL